MARDATNQPTWQQLDTPPSYVWPFGQGPDHAVYAAGTNAHPARGTSALPTWGPPTTYRLPAPRRRRPLTYVVGSLVILTVLALVTLGGVATFTGNGLVYRNEGYTAPAPDDNPPALPQNPSSSAPTLVERNPLYDQRVPSPIRCEIGTLVPDAGDEELRERADQLTACLMRAWVDPVHEAGYELYRPTVTVFSTKMDSSCGDLDPDNAFYCGTDQQIYLGTGLVDEFADTPLVVDMIIAHEFGHLVQGRTGILTATRALQQGAGSTERLEINRRFELQADCFAGLWIRAVTRSMGWTDTDLRAFADAANSAGDRPDRTGNHGKAQSRERWLSTGLDTVDVGSCNTYLAGADLVE